MRKTLRILPLLALVGACSDMSSYEKAVAGFDPVYCYRSLGQTVCYDKPNHRDEQRLVNFFGPAPRTYDKPAPAPEPELAAPRAIGYWARDPEPAPQPVIKPGQAYLDIPYRSDEAAAKAQPAAAPAPAPAKTAGGLDAYLGQRISGYGEPPPPKAAPSVGVTGEAID